ncbi:MAG: hypothetical protein V4559_16275 [Pseudomonadota bacterium]
MRDQSSKAENKQYRVSAYPQRSRRREKAKGVATAKENSSAAQFHEALAKLMNDHGDTCAALFRAISDASTKKQFGALKDWRAGRNIPRHQQSLALLEKIEVHYDLPKGYFAQKLAANHPTYKRNSNSDVNAFQAALNLQMRLHKDSSPSLARTIARKGEPEKTGTITNWKTGRTLPRERGNFEIIQRIELHYNLSPGYLSDLIARPESAAKQALKHVNPSMRSIFCWHLPTDFETRGTEEQQEIVSWIFKNVIGATTEYGRYHSKITQQGFSILFPSLSHLVRRRAGEGSVIEKAAFIGKPGTYGTTVAPARLAAEMENFIHFRTSLLPPAKFRRHYRWELDTARMAIRHFGIFFGALAAAPQSSAAGLGIPLKNLTFALLAHPPIFDWFLSWRQRRRGFFTTSEKMFLYSAKAILRSSSGWLRQHPELAKRVRPIPKVLSSRDIARANRNWNTFCDRSVIYIADRTAELRKSSRIHRDPFEAILPVLEADAPLAYYKKIADEILRHAPDDEQDPLNAALSARSYLLVRFAMQLGVRQRNLRELLICHRGHKPTSVSALENLKRGELRWNEREGSWEVFIPAVAFKNAGSSFFRGKPYRLILRDYDGLYARIERYLDRHRRYLLAGMRDPATFFVRSALSSPRTASYDIFGFYAIWKAIIQKYGIYNPYTGTGAIPGLLPHGPHSVRDIIATHILKQTGSYELASFALQDTVESVVRHYARFLPHEKVARAAEVLDRVWL